MRSAFLSVHPHSHISKNCIDLYLICATSSLISCAFTLALLIGIVFCVWVILTMLIVILTLMQHARFLTVIRSRIDYCIPTRTVTVGPRDPEFVTPFMKHLLVKRRRLRRCGGINEANAIATKINELIVAHCSKRLAGLLEATTKELWACVKNKKTEKQPIKINDKLADPEEFNSFFSAISTDSEYVLENINNFRVPYRHSGPIHPWSDADCNIIYNYQIEPLLCSLKNTAPGHDNLPAWLFKKCSFELADVVAKLLNMSFISGNVYSNWLIGIVTPVPMVTSPVTMNDFRPILVTPILSRLAEKLVVQHWLLPSIPLNCIEDQFTFRPSGSTTSALVSLIHHVASMLESNSFVRCLIIDFSKAFDVVNHEVLLQKVSTLDLPDNIHNWLVSFITGRQQKCKVNGSISSCSAITRSIIQIQGSGVGPTFYITMKGDLKPLSVHNVMCNYAEDINLLVPEHTDIDLKAEFNNVRQWAQVNKMILNLSKTKQIVFRWPCPKRDYLPPSFDDIELVDHIRCLGIPISHTFGARWKNMQRVFLPLRT